MKKKPQKVERHTALIDALASQLFPFQESEFEQESFTDVGRQRVDKWISSVLEKHYNYDEIARAALDAGIVVGAGSGRKLHFYKRPRLAERRAPRETGGPR